MLKKSTFLIAFILIFIAATSAILYSFQPPQGFTGAIAGSTCNNANCHNSFTLNTTGGNIKATGLPITGYAPGTSYNFSLTITHSVSDRKRWGFSIVARNSLGAAIGTFSTTNVNAALNGTELSHKNAPGSGAQKTFVFNNLTWKAPATDTIPVTFYFAGVAADSINGSLGDYVYTASAKSAPLPRAKIVAVKASSVNNCTNTNSLQYKCTQSNPPYNVQLYRYGLAYGSVRSVADTLAFTYSSLPIGSYYATARGHGGTDSLYGKSGTSVLMPVPTSLSATHITSGNATLKWTGYSCVKYYTVEYRVKGTTTWSKINTLGNKDSLNLINLTSNTKYQFSVASVDSARKIIATGRYSYIDSFITAASATITLNQTNLLNKAINKISTDTYEPVNVFPNPVSTNLRIQIKNNSFASAQLRSIDGKLVWSAANHTSLERGKVINVNVTNVPGGTYFLQLIDVNNNSNIKKIIVVK